MGQDQAALGKKLAQSIGLQTDPQQVADTEAVRALVRNTSTAAPKGEVADNAKLTDMSDYELDAHLNSEARRLSRGA